MEGLPRHQCLIYDGSPAKMLPAIAAHVKQRLSKNFRCLYLNSPAMVVGLRSYLYAIDVNVVDEVAAGRLIMTSDQSQLVEGQFSIDLMVNKLEEAVVQAVTDRFIGLWATGDMTWELGQDRNLKKLVDYEWKLDKLFHKYPELSGLCQYHMGSLSPDAVCNGLVCHPTIFVNETLTRLNPNYSPKDTPSEPISPSASLYDTIQNLCALQPHAGS